MKYSERIIGTVAALSVVMLCAETAHAAATAQQKCETAKLKAQGKLQACLKKNSANVILGKADASADCQTKFTTALAKADTKATAAGTSCRYLDNGDGTVSDLNTGLVWEQKTAGSGCLHCVNDPYAWSSSGTAPDGTAFTGFLGTLNNGASTDGGASTPITGCFANHCDWRLPTIVELQGIVDTTQGFCNGGSGACVDPVFGPTQADTYWSSTTTAGSPFSAWSVHFGFGLVNGGSKNGSYVRAVRGGL